MTLNKQKRNDNDHSTVHFVQLCIPMAFSWNETVASSRIKYAVYTMPSSVTSAGRQIYDFVCFIVVSESLFANFMRSPANRYLKNAQ